MSSEKTLPSVDLMSCQHGGEVIPSIAIERIISLRNEGIRVYLDGIDKLRKARDLMQQAGGCQYLYDYDKAVESAIKWSDTRPDQAETAISRVIDGKIWDRLMSETGMYTLMSNKQRQEWDRQVAGEEMPPITLENVMCSNPHLKSPRPAFTPRIQPTLAATSTGLRPTMSAIEPAFILVGLHFIFPDPQ